MSLTGKCCAVCEVESNLKKCSACEQVFYCSSQHQKHDWKNHKGNCQPYRITSNDALSGFLEATRDIKCGNVIFTENPLVIGPDWGGDLFETMQSFNCVGCFEPIKVFNNRCPNCKWPCCHSECIGFRNPKLHDIECPLLKGGLGVKHESDYSAIRNYYRTDVLFVLKCLMLQLKQPKKFHDLMDLQSHEEGRKAAKNFMKAEQQIDYLEENFIRPLKDFEAKTGKVIMANKSRKTLQQIQGIIETNALYLTENNQVCGLYATGCIMEHSCYPNCHFSFDKKNGFRLTVRAARDIQRGEHIATCYSNVLWGTQLRRQQLKETKYFKCCCERCVDPTELGTHFSSFKCIGTDESPCVDGIHIPTNPTSENVEWACNKCPVRIPGAEVAFLVEKMDEEIDNVMTKTPNVRTIETLMEKLANFLHPSHYHMFTLKHSLIQLYGNHRDYSIETLSKSSLMRKLKLCNDLMDTVRQLDPHNIRLSIYTAVILYEKFNSIVEMQRRQLSKIPCTHDEAVSCLKRAQMVLINELDTSQGKQLNDKISQALQKWNVK